MSGNFAFNRRDFNTMGLGLSATSIPLLFAPYAEAQDNSLEAWRLAALEDALVSADQNFNPETDLVLGRSSSVGYHTTLPPGEPVHPTRTAFQYALALLDAGGAERLQRAERVLRKAISLQDQDPDSPTYGIWSWYYEEPLEAMSPPDWNWADFNGKMLLGVWINHRNRLRADLRNQVRDSIYHAARSIQRRNVGPGYTNIAIMGTYVTLVAAERFEWEDLREYAKARLRRLRDYTFEQGSFSEYNSPTYTLVSIAELTRMLMDLQGEEDRAIAQELNAFAWNHASERFHPPTGQWGGPHSRCYSTLMTDSALAILEIATGRQGVLYPNSPLPLGLDNYRLRFHCPVEYRHRYLRLREPRRVIETFAQAEPDQAGRRTPVLGTTDLRLDYCLGSVNRGDLWRQRRSVVAYWGDPKNPRYMHIRFLKDGYDFSSALIFNTQLDGCLLSAVCFADNYGDTHISLDPVQNGAITTKDLRLRFEFGGKIDNLQIQEFVAPVSGWGALDEGIQFGIRPLGGRFGEDEWQWEQGGDENNAWIDAIAVSHEEPREIHLSGLAEAWLAFTLEVHSLQMPERDFGASIAHCENGFLLAHWTINSKRMRLQIPCAPQAINDIRDGFEGSITPIP